MSIGGSSWWSFVLLTLLAMVRK
ncbi:GlyGly-CTERM sorting domain-containing protein [Virgibacillus sp.]|nr:GlyGly-CTERM sorting domain-containing protein [Virgibacillus sp.]